MYQKEEIPSTYPIDIKVIIEKEKGKQVTELLQKIDINQCLDQNTNVLLKKLVIMIKNQFNFPFENKEIYYYLTDVDLFMNCGIDPINEDIRIRPENYQKNQLLCIKAKDLGISMVHRLMSFQNTNNTLDQKQRNGADQIAQKSKCRRTKERRIGHIIDKVIEWRKYYSGTTNQKNQPVKYSLEDAAKEVKISKKSLDDYLFQIRFGHRYGFNFNEHYNDKVGVLRDFVRQKKKNDKVEVKSRKNNTRQQND